MAAQRPPPSGAPFEHPSESPQASATAAATDVAARFSPEEEAALLDESNTQKAQANKLYSSSQYSEAVGEYDKALASCPNYLEYEIAVLKANVAACHLQLRDWKAAVDSATAALDALERLLPMAAAAKKTEAGGAGAGDSDDMVVELEGDDEEAEQALKKLELSDQRRDDVAKIRSKALMRRAKAKSELGGWGDLQGAEDDYKTLSSSSSSSSSSPSLMSKLSTGDRNVVQAALSSLPARINACKEKEMGEMMGKLKELGNGILKPFGLSTDNFNMVQDEKTGGYSMNFNQNR